MVNRGGLHAKKILQPARPTCGLTVLEAGGRGAVVGADRRGDCWFFVFPQRRETRSPLKTSRNFELRSSRGKSRRYRRIPGAACSLQEEQDYLAERVRFELTVPVKVQRFSRPSRSTTLAPLRAGSGGYSTRSVKRKRCVGYRGAAGAWRTPRGSKAALARSKRACMSLAISGWRAETSYSSAGSVSRSNRR
jgi:hypothetical protein